MAPALWVALLLQAPPLPEGNALVGGLVERHRQREEAVSRYTFDVLEVQERLDGKGAVEKRSTRSYEVFHVKGDLRAAGRKLLFKSFRTRVLASYGNYRRFDVDVEEGAGP